LGLGAANRDPAVFTNPDRLDIGRKEARILAFGFGPHFCVGSALAHLEASIFFHEIETRYPKLQLAVSPAKIEWRHTVSFRSPLILPVVTR
jgi:cytochrome P450 PksS